MPLLFVIPRRGFEEFHANARWTLARRRLDDADTAMYRVPSGIIRTVSPWEKGSDFFEEDIQIFS